jgi:hypothetical protein
VNATQAIAALTAPAARMLAVEILLAEREALGDDVLESALYAGKAKSGVIRLRMIWRELTGVEADRQFKCLAADVAGLLGLASGGVRGGGQRRPITGLTRSGEG